MATVAASSSSASEERIAELAANLDAVRARVAAAAPSGPAVAVPTLVAVSKLKPASDIAACYAHTQRDFGENYVQELVDKAPQLPADIRWHFIGALQSNKAKALASIPNLYAVHSLASSKAATALDRHLPPERTDALRVLLQVNTSGEDAKNGLAPGSADLLELARFVVRECPRLRLHGLMTIGALDASLHAAETEENPDFAALLRARDALEAELASEERAWGAEELGGRLALSMGMSADFEPALRAGSSYVRVGTSIFGSRPPRPAAA